MSITRTQGVYLADTARVVGEVTLGADVNLWYNAVIRGDVAPVTIGQGVNIQDGAVVHCDSDVPNTLEAHVSVGHSAIVHGKEVGEGTLIGMHATVLGQTVIGRRCLIAAGALVPPGLEVPDDHVVMGVPGRVVRETTDEERQYLRWLAPHYVELAQRHAEQRNATVKPWQGNG